MAMTSPALALAVEALFGNIKPTLNALKKLGTTDFSADAPNMDIKPGATIKVPVSSVDAAAAFDGETNNYTTGGKTEWASLTATHYLKGFDISGVNVDQGVNASRMKQLFTARAGAGIAMAIQSAIKSALDGVTAPTAASGKLPALTAVTAADYLALGDNISFLDKETSVLAVNGAELASIKAKFAAINITGKPSDLAQYMGFKDMVLIPGMTARAVIVPATGIGFIARVPSIVADYKESGVETDPDTDLSIGIVVANDQSENRIIANADLWFGCAVQSANAGLTTAGLVKIVTAS